MVGGGERGKRGDLTASAPCLSFQDMHCGKRVASRRATSGDFSAAMCRGVALSPLREMLASSWPVFMRNSWVEGWWVSGGLLWFWGIGRRIGRGGGALRGEGGEGGECTAMSKCPSWAARCRDVLPLSVWSGF